MNSSEKQVEVLQGKYEQNYQYYFIFVNSYNRQSDFLIAYLTVLGTISYYLLIHQSPSVSSAGIEVEALFEVALTISISIFFFLVSNIMDSLYGIYRLNAIIEVIESKLDKLVDLNFNTKYLFTQAFEPKMKISPALIWGAMGLIVYALILLIHVFLSLCLTSKGFSISYIFILLILFSFFAFHWQKLKQSQRDFRKQVEQSVS